MKTLHCVLPAAAAMFLLCAPQATRAATFTVTSTNDSGAGSLREAIANATVSTAKDTIQFSLPASGDRTITPLTPLPALNADILDATTQPGTTAVVRVILRNTLSQPLVTVTGQAAEIRGIRFSEPTGTGFDFPPAATGLLLSGVGSHSVSACEFTGWQTGIKVVSADNHIGGVAAAANRFAILTGVQIAGTLAQPAARTLIRGNSFKGLPPGGGFPMPFLPGTGVVLDNHSPDTRIESATDAINTFDDLYRGISGNGSDRLILAGNRLGDAGVIGAGIDNGAAHVYLAGCTDARIEGNLFRRIAGSGLILAVSRGVRVSGNIFRNQGESLGDGFGWRRAIYMECEGAMGADIGGNVISGVFDGIWITQSHGLLPIEYSGIRVHGNTVGLSQLHAPATEVPAAADAALLAPPYLGLMIAGAARNLAIGGAADPGTGHLGPNTILASAHSIVTARYNGTADAAASYPLGTNFSRNRIALADTQMRARQPIKLRPAASFPGTPEPGFVTPANDPLDADSNGGNALQNFPVISAVTQGGVNGTLDSSANASFTIQVYAAPSGTDSLLGVPVFLASGPASTDAAGHAAFSFPLTAAPPAGLKVWAIATDGAGNSSHASEFFRPDTLTTVSFLNPPAGELASEGTDYLVTLQRSGELATTTTVNFTAALSGGVNPAQAGDFGQPAAITFAPGETQKQVAIPISQDDLPEGRETFRVSLGDIAGGSAGSVSEVELTIAASDRIQLTLQSLTVAEGSAGTHSVSVSGTIDRVVNSNPPVVATSIYFIEEGNAFRNEDYTRDAVTPSHLVSFTGLSFTIPYGIVGDFNVETDETIIIRPDPARLSTFPDGTPVLDLSGFTPGVITITNDDLPEASVIPLSQDITEGGSGSQTAASLTIQLASAAPVVMPVQWQTGAVTATAGEDFTAASGEVVFQPGEISKVISVNVLGDDLVDRWPVVAETFHVDVTRPNGTATQTARATISITDDDVRMVTVGDASLTEGNAGNQVLTFTASISQATGSPVSFDWATADGDAGVADYVPVTGSVTIPAGQTSATFGVQVKGDTLYEFAETFRVLLTNNLNATLDRAEVTGTIQNDDTAPTLTVDSTVVTVGPDEMEYYAWFRIRTSAANGAPVQLNWSTQAETATPGTDYTESSGTITIPAGERTKWVSVPVLGDSEQEPDETFSFRIPTATGATVPAGGLATTATLKEVAISAFFPVPGSPNLYVIRFPTGKGQAYIVEESDVLDDEFSWVGVNTFQGSGTTVTHTQYSDSQKSYFRVRVQPSPPSN